MTTVTLEETPQLQDSRRESMLELISRGWSRSQIAKQYGISRQRVAQIVGLAPNRGKRQEIHVYALPEAFKEVANIALEKGLRHQAGGTAGGGSVGRLIEQIAEGKLVIAEPGELCANSEVNLGENSPGV
jgi:hypothetical protein